MPGNLLILKGTRDLKVCSNLRGSEPPTFLGRNPSNVSTPKFPGLYHCREQERDLGGLGSIQQSAEGERVSTSPRAARSRARAASVANALNERLFTKRSFYLSKHHKAFIKIISRYAIPRRRKLPLSALKTERRKDLLYYHNYRACYFGARRQSEQGRAMVKKAVGTEPGSLWKGPASTGETARPAPGSVRAAGDGRGAGPPGKTLNAAREARPDAWHERSTHG